MKRYHIKITEVGQEERTIGRSWKQGGEGIASEYGYTPEVAATRDYERQIYTQTVDYLDLKAVIAAVNEER